MYKVNTEKPVYIKRTFDDKVAKHIDLWNHAYGLIWDPIHSHTRFLDEVDRPITDYDWIQLCASGISNLQSIITTHIDQQMLIEHVHICTARMI